MHCMMCGDPATIVARRVKREGCTGGTAGKDYNLCHTCRELDRPCWEVRTCWDPAKMQKTKNRQMEKHARHAPRYGKEVAKLREMYRS